MESYLVVLLLVTLMSLISIAVEIRKPFRRLR